MGLLRRHPPGSEKWIERTRAKMEEDHERCRVYHEAISAHLLDGRALLSGIKEEDAELDLLANRLGQLDERRNDSTLFSAIWIYNMPERVLDRQRELYHYQYAKQRRSDPSDDASQEELEKYAEYMEFIAAAIAEEQAKLDELQAFSQVVEMDAEGVFSRLKKEMEECRSDYAHLHADCEETLARIRRHVDEELQYRGVVEDTDSSELTPLEAMTRRIYSNG